jgi:mono/diheme cytochrome c family protein
MSKQRHKHKPQGSGKSGAGQDAAGASAPETRAARPARPVTLSDEGLQVPPPERGGEPAATRTAVPVLLIALLGLMLYLGDIYLMANNGSFNGLVFYPYNSTNQLADLHPKSETQIAFEKGRRIYRANCAACHQESGLGVAGQFPPLAASDWVLTEGPNRIIRLVLNGIAGPIKVNGQGYNNVMVPWRDTLKDEDIAAVITYVRSEWGNKASAVTPAQVKKHRDATQDKAGSWSADDLLQLPHSD